MLLQGQSYVYLLFYAIQPVDLQYSVKNGIFKAFLGILEKQSSIFLMVESYPNFIT